MKIGDMVRLRSGGPTMTVIAIQPESESAKCCWFDPAGLMRSKLLPMPALRVVAEDDWSLKDDAHLTEVITTQHGNTETDGVKVDEGWWWIMTWKWMMA